MDFSDIIGQQEMSARLARLADEERMPHAMMLCGPDGAGKMALALALASHILNRGSFKVKGTRHPDLHFSFPTVKLKKCEYMSKRIGEVFEGVISGVTGWGFYVELHGCPAMTSGSL